MCSVWASRWCCSSPSWRARGDLLRQRRPCARQVVSRSTQARDVPLRLPNEEPVVPRAYCQKKALIARRNRLQLLSSAGPKEGARGAPPAGPPWIEGLVFPATAIWAVQCPSVGRDASGFDLGCPSERKTGEETRPNRACDVAEWTAVTDLRLFWLPVSSMLTDDELGWRE